MNIRDFENKTVQVDNYQATFLTLRIDNRLFRFDFIGKKEFNLKKGTRGQLGIYETHPLLIDYNENILTTYINSKPDQFEDFLTDFENAINQITEGWRSWTKYVLEKSINFTLDIFFNNVKSGTGKLIEAPFTVNEAVIKVCDDHSVATKTFGTELKQDNFKLLMIADNYVIAKEFRHHNY